MGASVERYQCHSPENQLKRGLITEFKNNVHEFVMVSWDEMAELYNEDPQFVRDIVGAGLNVHELFGGGAQIYRQYGANITGVYGKYINGKYYVILKGRPGLRHALMGTKYLGNNKILSRFGISQFGKYAPVDAIKGNVFSIVVTVGIEIYQYCIADMKDKDWRKLAGGLTSELSKLAIASALGAGAQLLVAKAGIVVLGSVAAAPVVAGVIVAIAVGYGLNKLDEEYQLTEKIVEAWKEGEKGARFIYESAKQKYQEAQDFKERKTNQFHRGLWQFEREVLYYFSNGHYY